MISVQVTVKFCAQKVRSEEENVGIFIFNYFCIILLCVCVCACVRVYTYTRIPLQNLTKNRKINPCSQLMPFRRGDLLRDVFSIVNYVAIRASSPEVSLGNGRISVEILTLVEGIEGKATNYRCYHRRDTAETFFKLVFSRAQEFY